MEDEYYDLQLLIGKTKTCGLPEQKLDADILEAMNSEEMFKANEQKPPKKRRQSLIKNSMRLFTECFAAWGKATRKT